jgi:hypothetical protein
MFLWALLGSAGLVGVLYAVMILMELSKRLGEVIRMPRYYRLFHLAALLIALAIGARVFWALSAIKTDAGPGWLRQPPLFYTLTYSIPLALGATLSLAVTWHYWSWLVRERHPGH